MHATGSSGKTDEPRSMLLRADVTLETLTSQSHA